MLGTLHGMQHHVCSTYGDSKTSQGCKEWGKPIAGIGQGNGASPQIWVAVSTPLFQIIAEEGFLAKIICVISIQECSLVRFGFVNNMDLCIMAKDNKLPTVLHRMQQSLQMWVDLLRATSRALLVPNKCFWYFVKPEWQQIKAKWTYTDPDSAHRLQVPDDEGESWHPMAMTKQNSST